MSATPSRRCVHRLPDQLRFVRVARLAGVRHQSVSTASRLLILLAVLLSGTRASAQTLTWQPQASIPDQLGLAGPVVGVHNHALIVAGGANFPQPVWDNSKVWHDAIYAATRDKDGLTWQPAGKLKFPIGYGACVSTPDGVLCIGGNDADRSFSDVFLLQYDKDTAAVTQTELPRLPHAFVYAAAARIGHRVFVAGGQTSAELRSATSELWTLDLSQQQTEQFEWTQLPSCPGPSRAFALLTAQHNGYNDCLYLTSGRREAVAADGTSQIEFLTDHWEYNPVTQSWRQRSDIPACMMAGTSAAVGQSHIMVFGGADGSRFFQADELKDDHPGFPKTAWAYHTITNTWITAGDTPANHVTTTAVRWDDDIIIATGEVRPRVRSPKVWSITLDRTAPDFGLINYTVLVVYLAAMVGIGLYFAKRNNTTDQFFRGGSRIPWWAAGCSIFATMLSSLTFTGVPSKAYAQDWVYFIGNMMIPVVAVFAVKVALPFFRRIDATSAYEFLEQRFNRTTRLFGSSCFVVFHIFRMAVVMSLTGLALAVATPLSPAQSVLLMGTLSIIYCSLGGIEAVIWTDTIQAVALLGGALVAFGCLIFGIDGGFSGFLESATTANKFNLANLHMDAMSAQVALWVIIVGGIGQNVSSYTADQAVVQRYMTTSDETQAARSIWTNALLAIPASALFFGMGTALFAFYQSHPERLDPGITTDQIFPIFIARELPVGLAGLLVAAIFAAAQSTVSTSMNSTATAIVTDFLKPFHLLSSDKAYLNAARLLTVVLGIAGTAIGLVFIDPDIKSLFDEFLKIIGLFMGVLGGLFLLGMFSQTATGTGALAGALVGAAVMYATWKYTSINGYLYATIGITTCLIIGQATPGRGRDAAAGGGVDG
ncbi:MAG: sodium/solute symporter [Planctomycetaceae bacterium]|nr:sodium/solute symporter [Planctomycetaceae bacterium]